MTLSTIKPATSPCLSIIPVDLTHSCDTTKSPECLTEDARDNLQWIANEAVRIEREFDRAVNLTVSRNPEFKAVLDALSVRFRSVSVDWMPPRAFPSSGYISASMRHQLEL